MMANHPNIVNVLEIVVGENVNQIFIVMEFVEHDLKALMENMREPFSPSEIKTIMLQLVRPPCRRRYWRTKLNIS